MRMPHQNDGITVALLHPVVVTENDITLELSIGEFWPQEGAFEIPAPKWSDALSSFTL